MYTSRILTAFIVCVTFVSSQKVYEDVKTLREVLRWCEKYGYYTGEVEKLSEEELRGAVKQPIIDAKIFSEFEEINDDITEKFLKYVKTPRCGDKDIRADSTNEARRTKRWARFKSNPHLWKSFPLILSISQGSTTRKILQEKLDKEEFKKMLIDSMKVWSKASGVSFKFDPNAIAPHIMVSFGPINPVNVVGTSDGPKDGSRDEVSSIQLNSRSQFKTQYRTPGPGYSLRWTVMHELGHSLGLGHSSDKFAIMYPYGTKDYNDQVLTDDDLNGIRALYGPSNGKSVEVSTSAPRKVRQRAPVFPGRAPAARTTRRKTTRRTTRRPATTRRRPATTTRRSPPSRRPHRRPATRRPTQYRTVRTTTTRRPTTRRTTPYRRPVVTRRPYVYRRPATTTQRTTTLRKIVSRNQRPPVTFRPTRRRQNGSVKSILKYRRFMSGK